MKTSRHQRGIIVIFVAIGLVAMLATAALALDGAHGMINKTRLQNLVDAAALSAAKTLDQSNGNVTAAQTEALAMFTDNAGWQGNSEIQSAYSAGTLSVSVQFSNTLEPFVPGSVPAQFVRVAATNLRLPGWFTTVVGMNEKVVGASAVSGPSPTLGRVCNIAPMMACGDASDPTDPYFGYTPNEPDILKTAAAGGNFQVGPGNFQLVRLPGSQGAADVRRALAGDYDACVETQAGAIETEPGNTVGPLVQGINTRFGVYTGPMNGTQSIYPPDVIVEQPAPRLTYNATTDQVLYQGLPVDPNAITFFDHGDYESLLGNGPYAYPPPVGQFGRRILAMPVGDCTGTVNGQGTVPLLGVACIYLLQQAVQQGNQSHVYGQFVSECAVTGRPGPAPVSGPGPHIIQLYKDPGAVAS